METSMKNLLCCFIISFLTWKSVNCISCYQCSSTDSENPFQCNEFLDSDVNLLPINCSNIHDAQFCIKHVGRNQVAAIDCYQCNTSFTIECSDGLMSLDGGVLKPTPCDHVYNAQYCIKHSGGIGTERYCSALNLGTYCNYVNQPGDKLKYRSCIYTCSTDGCNSAYTLRIPSILLLIACLFLKYFCF